MSPRFFQTGCACLAMAALAGCASLNLPAHRPPPSAGPVPCVYRFKMLTRPEDQARVEAAIHTVAVGPVVKAGTVTYPEYRFRVARLADLDSLTASLLYANAGTLLTSRRRQTVNLSSASVEMGFDSTDVSAHATTFVTFAVKPGSRLYYKHPGGAEMDITAKVDKQGKIVLPVTIQEGQKYVYARAMKDNVTRYIRINIFTGQAQDITRREY